MHALELYQQVLPNADRLRMFEQSELEAVAELLVALAQLGDHVGDDSEYGALRRAWLDLFADADPTARATLSAHIDTSFERVRNLFSHPNAFGILLASSCSRLRSPITQFHAMCLLIVSVFLAGPDERQIELCYRIGRKFGMDDDRTRELFRRMWLAFHTARAQLQGLEYPGEYVDQTRWHRRSTLFEDANPFEKR